ncbi:hypothetical protein RH08_02635 [Candidatus Liberibacter asiaticus]|uniref:Transmembrane protein n=2 Tax=Liberibacter asiaticus TaxID=34021 RepID=C6XFJ9_LIBAP|nr:hypothetical protein [Candidatus Liberibacter asiaticus]ACT57152.1 hypothetical protein CLIBASIA_02830 [Candidatus Liberibacter asiaticus str. psy62]AGH16884.1 hypothetical protein WSI_02570 [Candidatus Liberibacter asiaticus str. gxpsy]BAP26405.1 hypothetical protein CGUJ_02830 [Candidatus Liberibacter asiaticus str. Ishi-1]ALK07237.1 hypothetical protein CD16_02600 [Candidatus Liberibacter asiaticus]ASK52722.1 hypothetical protein B2I23_02640 [Candidatus Liberibacter asiaticus]
MSYLNWFDLLTIMLLCIIFTCTFKSILHLICSLKYFPRNIYKIFSNIYQQKHNTASFHRASLQKKDIGATPTKKGNSSQLISTNTNKDKKPRINLREKKQPQRKPITKQKKNPIPLASRSNPMQNNNDR